PLIARHSSFFKISQETHLLKLDYMLHTPLGYCRLVNYLAIYPSYRHKNARRASQFSSIKIRSSELSTPKDKSDLINTKTPKNTGKTGYNPWFKVGKFEWSSP